MVAALVPFAVAALLALAPSALALGCEDPSTCGGGGGGGPTFYVLTVTPEAGTPAGAITSDQGGIACPGGAGACTEAYAEGTDVTLTASRSGFVPAWSGCTDNGNGTCSVAMGSAVAVGVTWHDVSAPVTTMFTAPAKVRSSIPLSADGTDNVGVAKVVFKSGSVVIANDTSYPFATSLDVSAASFPHNSTVQVSAQAFDAAGNGGNVMSKAVTIDKQTGLQLDSLPAFTNQQTVPVGFQHEMDATTTCALDGMIGGPCSSPWSPIGAGTADGTYTYEVTATDDVGNVATGARTFVLDRTAPQVGFSSGPAAGSSGTATDAAFTLTATDANLDHVSCRLDSLVAQDCSSLSAAFSGLGAGAHTLTVTGVDKAGNQASQSRSWTVTAPGTTAGNNGGTGTNNGGTGANDGGLLANPAKITIKLQRTARWTRLKKITIGGLPTGATVTVACKGGKAKGCPKARTLAALKKAPLKPGAVITITVAKAGMETKTVTITVRRGKAPTIA